MLAAHPAVPPLPISHFNYELLNRPEHSLCHGCLDAEFNNGDTPLSVIMTVSKPTPAPSRHAPPIGLNIISIAKVRTLPQR